MNKDAQELRNDMLARIEERAQRELNDQRYDWVRSPNRRRSLVILNVVSALAFGVGVITDAPAVIGLGLLTYIVTTYLGRRATRGIMDLPDELLDERQAGSRNKAFRLAYMVHLCTLSLAFVLATVTFAGLGLTIASDHIVGSLLTLFALGLSMPTNVFAWIEPEL